MRTVSTAIAGLTGIAVSVACSSLSTPPEVPKLKLVAVIEPDGTVSRDLTGVTPPEVARISDPKVPQDTPMHVLPAVVVLRATVTPEGGAEDIRVVSGPTADIKASAVACLSRWRFRAATRGDRPVPVRAEFRIGYSLS